MRFPDTPMMKRVFHLFDTLNEHKSGSVPVIEYYFNRDNNIGYFNGIRLTQPQIKAGRPDPFHTGVPDLVKPVNDMVMDQLRPFRDVLQTAIKSGETAQIKKAWKTLEKYDKYSTRSYMTLVGNPPDGPVNDDVSISIPSASCCRDFVHL
jgi:hypothetical protein